MEALPNLLSAEGINNAGYPSITHSDLESRALNGMGHILQLKEGVLLESKIPPPKRRECCCQELLSVIMELLQTTFDLSLLLY